MQKVKIVEGDGDSNAQSIWASLFERTAERLTLPRDTSVGSMSQPEVEPSRRSAFQRPSSSQLPPLLMGCPLALGNEGAGASPSCQRRPQSACYTPRNKRQDRVSMNEFVHI